MIQPTQYSPTIVLKPTAQVSGIRIALALIALLIAIGLGLLVLLVIGVETGPVPFVLGFITATIPVPLYLALVLWIDRYESEPLWMLGTAFFWGVLVAPFFAFLFNTTAGYIAASLAGDFKAGELFAAVFSAPIVEEIGKAVILFAFFIWCKDEFDGVIDGIVYASLAGLGFAMTENVLYYGKAVLDDGGPGLTATFIIRGALAPFSHPLFTSLTGIGLGIARQSRNAAVKILLPIAGLLLAIFMHFIWNGSAAFGGGPAFLLTYVLIMVPAFAIMIVIIILGLRREGQVVREFLLRDLEGGLFTREEYDQLGSVRGRMGSSFNAFSRGGVSTWRKRMRLNQLASELAFHRSRVARGLHSSKHDVRELENAYLQILQSLLHETRGSANTR
ncbi:MAG TPA: PrsW family intramembrane metalloprotease [Pyrinomonadaceae bacterium]|nr:PrsW family intramembrane metalloprotease [Pyrinomonadaceae bacterium]